MILPTIAFIMIYQYISCKIPAAYKNIQRAEAIFRTIVLFEAIILVMTNVLSIFHILTRTVSFIAWLLIILIFSVLYGKYKKDRTLESIGQTLKKLYHQYQDKASEKNSGKNVGTRILFYGMLAVLAVLSLVLLFGTIFTVPYNYDSMTYHLARIVYWIDHQSVAHYITNIDRQIYSPVLDEYNLLYIMLLSGNDTFVNFLQYFSMFAAAYFIYHSARKLGTAKIFSFFGAFIFMLMPLTISQSITTQNDLFAALIFILFIYKLLDVIKWEAMTLDKSQILDIVMLGLLVGYAYLAKTSVCASMVMFMPWLAIVRICKKDSVKNIIKAIGLAAGSIVVTISETLIRTFLSSHSLMTSTASGNIMVATKNAKYIIVNILKNFSMLITQNYYRPLNGFVYRIAIGLGQKWNVEVNNEAIAFHGFDFLHHMNMGDDMYSHDKTPSAFVAYLSVIGGVIMVTLLISAIIKRIVGKKAKTADLVKNTSVQAETNAWIQSPMAVSIGFAISSWLSLGFIMALLRWQPWGTRLMYPALSVTVIMSVNMLSTILHDREKLATAIITALSVIAVALAVPSVTYNLQPSWNFVKGGCQNRINQYFYANHREDGYEDMIRLAEDNGDLDIGLIISGDGYDYPLWLMLRSKYPEAKLRHLIMEDAADSSQKAPDCIFMIERDVLEVGEIFEYAGTTYTCVYQNEASGDCYLEKSENTD